jgi:hypothetical protein
LQSTNFPGPIERGAPLAINTPIAMGGVAPEDLTAVGEPGWLPPVSVVRPTPPPFAGLDDLPGYDPALAGLDASPDLNPSLGLVRSEPFPIAEMTIRPETTRMWAGLGVDLEPGITSAIPDLIGLGLSPEVAESFGSLLDGRAGASADSGEIPSVRSRSGQSSDAADGGGGSLALDIARINELLQQLLGEVRKTREPFLPLRDFGSGINTSSRDYN